MCKAWAKLKAVYRRGRGVSWLDEHARSGRVAPEVRGIVCEFKSYTALEEVLEQGRDERDLDMPECEAVRDGEWLVVTVIVGVTGIVFAWIVSIVTVGNAFAVEHLGGQVLESSVSWFDTGLTAFRMGVLVDPLTVIMLIMTSAAVLPTPTQAGLFPDISITLSHTGSFYVGSTDAAYTYTVKNAASASSTVAVINVSDALPTGITFNSIIGLPNGWICLNILTVSCTNAVVLGPNATATFTVGVNIDSTAVGVRSHTADYCSGPGLRRSQGHRRCSVRKRPRFDVPAELSVPHGRYRWLP